MKMMRADLERSATLGRDGISPRQARLGLGRPLCTAPCTRAPAPPPVRRSGSSSRSVVSAPEETLDVRHAVTLSLAMTEQRGPPVQVSRLGIYRRE